MVLEPTEDDEYEDEDYADEEATNNATWMKDSARKELEALAAKLQNAGYPNELCNEEEVEQLEQATATLALTSEALETVRAARETLKGLKGKKGGGRFGRAHSAKGGQKDPKHTRRPT